MEKLLTQLIELRSAHAHEALLRPSERSSFEYGRVSGLYQGLTMSIEAVQNMLADNEERDE